jgi:hypothetical protein
LSIGNVRRMLKMSLSERTSFSAPWHCASLRENLGFRNNGSRENQISGRMFEVRRGLDGIA